MINGYDRYLRQCKAGDSGVLHDVPSHYARDDGSDTFADDPL